MAAAGVSYLVAGTASSRCWQLEGSRPWRTPFPAESADVQRAVGELCAWGSPRWLSYRSEFDSEFRAETSGYWKREADIALWMGNASTLIGS